MIKELIEIAHTTSQNRAVNKPEKGNVPADPQGSKTIFKESCEFSKAKLFQEMALNAIHSLNQGFCSMMNGQRSVFNKWQNSAFEQAYRASNIKMSLAPQKRTDLPLAVFHQLVNGRCHRQGLIKHDSQNAEVCTLRMPLPLGQNSEPFCAIVKIDLIRSAPGMQLTLGCSQVRINSSFVDFGLERLEALRSSA